MSRGTAILCPRCGERMDTVLETRQVEGTIRRRRRCPAGHTEPTREVLERDLSAQKVPHLVS